MFGMEDKRTNVEDSPADIDILALNFLLVGGAITHQQIDSVYTDRTISYIATGRETRLISQNDYLYVCPLLYQHFLQYAPPVRGDHTSHLACLNACRC